MLAFANTYYIYIFLNFLLSTVPLYFVGHLFVVDSWVLCKKCILWVAVNSLLVCPIVVPGTGRVPELGQLGQAEGQAGQLSQAHSLINQYKFPVSSSCPLHITFILSYSESSFGGTKGTSARLSRRFLLLGLLPQGYYSAMASVETYLHYGLV